MSKLDRFSPIALSCSRALLVGSAVATLAGCQVTSKTETASPVAQASPTPVRMLAIVTPTPPGQGAAPTTDQTPTPAPPVEAQPNAEPTQPAANPGTYVIKQGDTLYAIAVQYKVSIQALMEANAITDPTSIQAGQVLVIPTSSTP